MKLLRYSLFLLIFNFVNLYSNVDCGICLEEIKNNAITLPCHKDHKFHKDCIVEWFATKLKNNQSMSCPYCRGVCSKDDVINLGLGEELGLQKPQCMICYDDLDTNVITLPCHKDHKFHKNCIVEWFLAKLKNKEPMTCPYCRKEFSKDLVIKMGLGKELGLEKPKCSICLSNLTQEANNLVLSCGHKYHKECIIKWFKTKINENYPWHTIEQKRDEIRYNSPLTCPLCRTKIYLDEIVNLGLEKQLGLYKRQVPTVPQPQINHYKPTQYPTVRPPRLNNPKVELTDKEIDLLVKYVVLNPKAFLATAIGIAGFVLLVHLCK